MSGAVVAGGGGGAPVSTPFFAGTSGPFTPHPGSTQASAIAQTIARVRRRTIAQILARMLDDSDFIAAADATLDAIGRALDAALAKSDLDLDWTQNDGILTIEGDDGGKLIVNRHVPNREIWLAARAGGFHFRPLDGRWRDTRSGDELGAALARLLKSQMGLDAEFGALPAP